MKRNLIFIAIILIIGFVYSEILIKKADEHVPVYLKYNLTSPDIDTIDFFSEKVDSTWTDSNGCINVRFK